MDTHSVLVLTVIIMSIAIVALLSFLETSQQRIRGLSLQLEENSKKYQREKYRNLRAGSMDTR